MTDAPRQLPLDLPVETRLEVEDFVISSSNEVAYQLIEKWPDWPDRVLLLTGPEASGNRIWRRFGQQNRALGSKTLPI